MAVIDDIKSFLYSELPNRPVLLQGYIGDPNDTSIQPDKVNLAPLGTFYLEESTPRKLFVRTEMNNDGKDWKLLSDGIHDLQYLLDCCNDVGIELINIKDEIDTLKTDSNDLSDKVKELDKDVYNKEPTLDTSTIPEYLNYPTSTIEIDLNNDNFTYTGGITISPFGNIDNVTIVGDKLIIDISGLPPSEEFTITIPSGSISGSEYDNPTDINIPIKTKGDKPILSIPMLSNVDPSVATMISIPVTFPTTPLGYTFDDSKIYSKNGMIVGTPVFNTVTNEIEIMVNLDYEKEYEINIYEGVIVADVVNSDYGEIKFKTISNPSPPISPTPIYDWQYEFVLKNGRGEYDLSTDSGFTHPLPTIDDLYFDGKIELFYLGYDGTPLPTPLKVPMSGIDTFTAPTDNGGFAFYADGYIVFDTGGYGNRRFRMDKLP